MLNRLNTANATQGMIHQIRKCEAVYIDVYAKLLPVVPGNGPFLVTVNDNLFNFQVMRGMIPYEYSSRVSQKYIVKLLELWGKIYRGNSFAVTALSFQGYGLKEAVDQVAYFFDKESQRLPIPPKQYKLMLWLHRYGVKKIYECVNTDKSRLDDLNAIRYSCFFNGRWYRKKYLNGLKDIDPAEHYLYTGYKDGYDPSPRFSTKGYLELYPDILGINPLWYYEKHGKLEKRNIESIYKQRGKK